MTCPATRMKIGLNREACLRNAINLIISRLRRVDAPEALHHATHVLHLPKLLCSKNACNQLSDGVWRRSFQLQHFTQQAAGGKTPDSQTLNLLQSQLASDCILREAKPFKRIGCAPRMNASIQLPVEDVRIVPSSSSSWHARMLSVPATGSTQHAQSLLCNFASQACSALRPSAATFAGP